MTPDQPHTRQPVDARSGKLHPSPARSEALARRELQIKEAMRLQRGCGGCRGRSIHH
jgi:hypothetical protein